MSAVIYSDILEDNREAFLSELRAAVKANDKVMNELSDGLLEKGLISSERSAYVVRLDQYSSPSKAPNHLLSAVIDGIKELEDGEKSSRRSFQTFIDVLRANPSLTSFADRLEAIDRDTTLTTDKKNPYRQASDVLTDDKSETEDDCHKAQTDVVGDTCTVVDSAVGTSDSVDPDEYSSRVEAEDTEISEGYPFDEFKVAVVDDGNIHPKNSSQLTTTDPSPFLNATPLPPMLTFDQSAGDDGTQLTNLMTHLQIKKKENYDLNTKLVKAENELLEKEKEKRLNERITEIERKLALVSWKDEKKELIDRNEEVTKENIALREQNPQLILEKRTLESRVKGLEDAKQELMEFKSQYIKKQVEIEKKLKESTDGAMPHTHSHSLNSAVMGTEQESKQKVTDWELVMKNGILSTLGEGGSGVVYEGICRMSGCRVAVKAIKPQWPRPGETENSQVKETMENIIAEITMLSSLDGHENIITYHSASYRQHQNFPEKHLFIVTDLMEGGSLHAFIRKKGLSNDIDRMKNYSRQILEGVRYLHERHPPILHRDIKGGNILMDKTYTCIKLADFGCAKEKIITHDHTVKTSKMYGTISWSSPEVLKQEKACEGSDIWSVGATVVEMFNGRMPFTAELTCLDIAEKVKKGEIDPMKQSLCDKSVPEDLKLFLSACFKFKPKERPSAAILLSSYSFCRQSK